MSLLLFAFLSSYFARRAQGARGSSGEPAASTDDGAPPAPLDGERSAGR